jgi:hypothetical protein
MSRLLQRAPRLATATLAVRGEEVHRRRSAPSATSPRILGNLFFQEKKGRVREDAALAD